MVAHTVAMLKQSFLLHDPRPGGWKFTPPALQIYIIDVRNEEEETRRERADIKNKESRLFTQNFLWEQVLD